jgi:hypothetical protein
MTKITNIIETDICNSSLFSKEKKNESSPFAIRCKTKIISEHKEQSAKIIIKNITIINRINEIYGSIIRYNYVS